MIVTAAAALDVLIGLLFSFTVTAVTTGNSAGPCFGECAAKWKKCGGSGFDGFSACCDEGFSCYSVNKYYSQCRRPNSVQTGWTGPFICSAGGNCADPKAVVSVWSSYELSDTQLALARFQHEDLETTTCAEECDKLSACVAYQENEDGGSHCNLYGDGVISIANKDEGTWSPNFDSELHFVKCYRPPALCPEDTIKEVDGTDPRLYELRHDDIASVFLTPEFAVGDCASICRMHDDGCVGFALRDSLCYPLFDVFTSDSYMKEVELGAGTTVYSISSCLS